MPVADPLTTIGWDVFEALDSIGKAGYLKAPDGRENHVLIAQQFDRLRLDALGALATRIRRLSKDESGLRFLRGVMAGRRAMLYFTQPSSRTFLSFCAACQILGICIGEVRDKATSSEFKGKRRKTPCAPSVHISTMN